MNESKLEEKERLYLDKVIAQMTQASSHIKQAINKFAEETIAISLLYSYLGKSFQFTANKELEKKISEQTQKLELQLYNGIYERCNTAKELAYKKENEDDTDDNYLIIFLFLQRKINNKTIVQRIKEYVLNLGYELEAFIAFGIFKKSAKEKILLSYMTNMKSPFKALEMIQAYSEKGFKAERIASKGISFGVGKAVSSFNNLKRLEQDTIFKTYNHVNQTLWLRDPNYIGWSTIRGSNYPCPICDSQVGIFHPRNESYLGYHGRCCCLCIPVFR